MKKTTFFILVILLSCKIIRTPDGRSIQANSRLSKFKGDSLGYVQKSFIDNKRKYIGKDLNYLLKDLEIPVKSFTWGTSFIGAPTIPSVNLYFYTMDKVSKELDRQFAPPNLIIKWVLPLQ